MAPRLPRIVVVLGMVAFLNDAASEMITPLLPVFLVTTLGAGPAIVGLVEGVAESLSSILKLVSGWLVDRGWRARRLVLGGYGLSNSVRPLLGLAFGWTWVLVLRALDRIGKGLRTSPRDAMIAVSVSRADRGRGFGFHRGMDHAGAMLGAAIAFALLYAGAELQTVFMLSVVPGIAVMLLLRLGLPEPVIASRVEHVPLRWHGLAWPLRGLILSSGVLALATVPEAFLVLWAMEHGVGTAAIPLLWMLGHACKSILAYAAGDLSDRLGRVAVVVAGWGGRIAVMLLIMTLGDGPLTVWCLFVAYGAALACSEGAERALIGDYAPSAQRATAFGLYHLVSSLFALPGAVGLGLMWEWQGWNAALMTAAVVTAVAAGVFLTLVSRMSVSARAGLQDAG
ncbi:MAG: MFS transporter [Gammaproteobacteria bacterium]